MTNGIVSIRKDGAMSGYRTLKEGDRVEYEIIDRPKGKPQANNVVVID